MSELLNSIWPNGIKKDADGYSVYYPLGTNKIDIPDGSKWPKGTKLKFPFVYGENGQLTGFCDTKSMIANSGTNIYLPYKEIEADFSSIDKGTLGIHAPNATVKKAIWKDSEEEDIPGVEFKYKGCKTVDDVKAEDANYQTTDIVNGTWSEPLWDLVQGGKMFYYCDNLRTFSADLSNLTDGYQMFSWCNNLTIFSADLSNLTNGQLMFNICRNLTSFSSDLSSLTNSNSMFNRCSNLTTFTSDLSSLTDGYCMFNSCTKLSSFSSDLSSLTNGDSMFADCSKLNTFNSDLSSLTDGRYMFNSCDNLNSFSSDLSSLTIGTCMFDGCPMLTSFSSNLSSLTDGNGMFNGCSLDTISIQNIADTIKDVTSVEDEYNGCGCGYLQNKTINIGIGNTSPNEQESAAFHKMADKGWTVYVNGNQVYAPAPAAITTLDENGEEVSTSIPFYAKPVQTDEKYAEYTDGEGNFFIILGGQYIYGDDISTYGMFTCEEDAAANMRLTKIERN